MPQIQIRPAAADDIAKLTALEHDYTSDNVWQMEVVSEEKQVGIQFRQIRLPRSVRVEYPRSPSLLEKDWEGRQVLLVAQTGSEADQTPAGYISANTEIAPASLWITDLVVMRRMRRQGIGSALLLAVQEWGRQRQDLTRIVLEMQPKNYPAICMAQKLGFDLCGYHDPYYANRDIALFFAKGL